MTSNLDELIGMWEDHAEWLTQEIREHGSPTAMGARDAYEACAAQLRAAVKAND
jgi:hypothetical protein